MNPAFELISHVLCPYVQRSVIVLHEKRTPYRRTDIDLASKPDWFKKVSPLGKVPVLVDGERRALFESAVICEYLNDVTPGDLHPEDPWKRAEHRAWIEVGSGVLNEIARMYNASTPDAFDAACDTLGERLRQLENRLGNGPYFAGTRFCLVDAVYGPIFRYFDVLGSMVNPGVMQELEKVQRWRDHLRARPSVQGAVTADYPERLLAFVRNRGSYLSSLLADTDRQTGRNTA